MPARKNPDSEDNIKRIDTPAGKKKQTHGFQVHFKRTGSTWTKFFSDAIFGDKEEARQQARKFREVLRAQIPETKDLGPSRAGAAGYVFRERTNRDGSVAKYISVSVRDRPGHAVNKAIRIEGDDIQSAIKEALAWRTSVIEQRLKEEK